MQTHIETMRIEQGLPSIYLYRFYSSLEVTARNKTKSGEPKGTECPFTREEVLDALKREGKDRDHDELIATAIEMRYIEQRGDNFYITSGALAAYQGMIRRI